MKKLLLLLCTLTAPMVMCWADSPAYFSYGPIALNVPFKTVAFTYLYDFHAGKNMVGGETPFITLWSRVEGDAGVVTSLEGEGTPFVGGNILVGNLLDKYITLPSDLKVGGYGGWDFHTQASIYGVKASYRLW